MLLRHAQLFCEVCARRSFSAAARVLSVSQPTVSAAVSQIEKDLGVALLDRSSRPLVVTPAGQIYETGCRSLLRQIAELEENVRAAGDRLAGTIRVAAIYSVGLLEIRTLVAEFEASHPDVHVEIEYCHPDEVYERLRTGRAELGLVAFAQPTEEFDATLWQRQTMAAIVPPEHPLARRKSIRLRDLAGERFVTLKPGLTTRSHLDRLFAERQVTVESVGQFDNFDTLRRAVVEGDGLSIVPSAIFQTDARMGLVRLLPIHDPGGRADPDLVRPLGIVTRSGETAGAAATAFREALLTMPGRETGPEAATTRIPEPLSTAV